MLLKAHIIALVRIILSFSALFGCEATSQDRVSLPLWMEGSEERVVSLAEGGRFELSEARLAFGPLYLCAGAQAGELCETARLEWLGSAVLEGLSAERVEVGALEGVSGEVASWMYDLGLSAQLTAERPFELEAARALNGHSVALSWAWFADALSEQRADEAPLARFVASLKIQQEEGTERGVPVVRKSTSERFFWEASADSEGLLVRVTPHLWLSNLTPARLLSDSVCEGNERSDEGEPLDLLSASQEELVAYAGRCEGVWRVAETSLSARALTLSISSSARPQLSPLP